MRKWRPTDKTDFTNIAAGRRAALEGKVSKSIPRLLTARQVLYWHFKFLISLIVYTNPMKKSLLKIHFYLLNNDRLSDLPKVTKLKMVKLNLEALFLMSKSVLFDNQGILLPFSHCRLAQASLIMHDEPLNGNLNHIGHSTFKYVKV